MVKDALLSAVRDGKPWLERFARTEYEKAFEEYRRQYGAMFREAVREGGAALADELAEELAKGWASEKFWKRSTRRFEEKQMIFAYLSPMLLEIGEEAFAASLRDAWRKRWPKDAYEIVTWRKLQKGFRLTLLGVEIGRQDED